MRLRLFFSFLIITIITLLVLGIVLQSNTQTTITNFAQSGGFYASSRVITEYANYYAENGSFAGITSGLITTTHGENEGSANPNPGGAGHGSGMGMGSGNQQGGQGNSAMGMNISGEFTLIDPEGTVLMSQSLPVGEKLEPSSINNGLPIDVDGEVIGYLIPDANLVDLSELIGEELSSALKKSLLPTTLIASGAAILLAVILAAILVSPIQQLTGAADRIAGGDLSQRVPVKGKDEINQLALSFNQMADSLEEAQQARQAMTADIAHELRTPLSIQRANLEALQDGIYPLTQENLTTVVQQNSMLTKLVEDLRTLAIADAGGLQLELINTDLTALIARIREDFQARFDEARVTLTTQFDLTCPTCQLDPGRISQVIYNVLQNSLRHTPEGGSVEIITSCTGESAQIFIRDTGEGIPEEALPHLFDRFYRSDQSRSRDMGGSGLGLAIARQIVLAHNGEMSAGNHPEGGAVFTIDLPTRGE